MSSISPESLNPNFLKVQYAVRGELAIKAEEYRVKLKKDPKGHGLPFDRVIFTNIGNPQQKGLDQKPITFGRQVAALMEYPEILDNASSKDIFPSDVIERAHTLREEIGSVGAYSHSQGVPYIRQVVADFIEKRDGYPSNPDHIFLTAGASSGVSLLLSLLIASPKTGILIPIPQYPLYSAALAQFGGSPINYYLDESQGWSTSIEQIEESIAKAKKDGVEPKSLVVINPGNPTGGLLTADTQREILKLCEKHNLVLMADEVYQSNLHLPSSKWTSFKKLLRQMDSPVPLFSFHSISKGVTGECGRRGGYFEAVNIPSDVIAHIYKMASVGLCPPLQGQIGVECMVNPPSSDGPSYKLWKAETDAIHSSLAERTKLMSARLNKLEGMSVVEPPGSLYLFPRITLPKRAIEAAEKEGKSPDLYYALRMLDETGICVVHGAGFGQKEGEWHFRLTCLCSGVEDYVGRLESFHKGFMEKWRD